MFLLSISMTLPAAASSDTIPTNNSVQLTLAKLQLARQQALQAEANMEKIEASQEEQALVGQYITVAQNMTTLKASKARICTRLKCIDFCPDHSYYVCDIPRRSLSRTEFVFDHSLCHIHAAI